MIPNSRGRKDLKIRSLSLGPRLRAMEPKKKESFWESTFLFSFSLLRREGDVPDLSIDTEHVAARARRGQHTRSADVLIPCQHCICLSLRVFKNFKMGGKWSSVFLGYLCQRLYGLCKSLALLLCHGHTPVTLPPKIIITYVLCDHYILYIWSYVK